MATYENGDAEKDIRRDTIGDNDGADMGEYGNLVRYISTYRDGRRGSTASGGAGADPHEKKKGFFSRKKKGEVSGVFETPDDWLTTDMKAGLRSSDVEARRRKTGWNELTTEKENLFLKFVGFFKGPVLYGMFNHFHFTSDSSSHALTNHSILQSRSVDVWIVCFDGICVFLCTFRGFPVGRRAIEIAGSTQNTQNPHPNESIHTSGTLHALSLQLQHCIHPEKSLRC